MAVGTFIGSVHPHSDIQLFRLDIDQEITHQISELN
jgi:hypothetical protein